jgi:hypothetical protein
MPKTIVPAELTTELRRRRKVRPIFISLLPSATLWVARPCAAAKTIACRFGFVAEFAAAGSLGPCWANNRILCKAPMVSDIVDKARKKRRL